MASVQSVVPAQSPLQPENVARAAAIAVSVTVPPTSKLAVQVGGQAIPAGRLVTVPGPATPTDSVVIVEKFAITAVSAPSVTIHVPVPEHPPPLQPPSTEPALGVAVSVTTVFAG